ncbi:filamentous hemagglutinin N-terminal domain-containing protein, partial [Microbulbifer harenosus]
MNMKKSSLAIAVEVAKLTCLGLITTNSVVAAPGTINSATGNVSEIESGSDAIYQIDGKFGKIDWDSFDVLEGDSVTFRFGGNLNDTQASSIIVNKVLTGTTDISGNVISNGHVVLVNPRGILFSENSSVNVQALTLSALDGNISGVGENFTFEILENVEGDVGVVNTDGQIIAPNGVTLIGKSVKNFADINQGVAGDLIAGNVNFYSADKAVLSLDENGLIGVEITRDEFVEEFQSDFAEYAIQNTGNINAANVVMEARVADGFTQAAINNSGIITARGITESGGVIRLSASSYDGESVAAVNLTGSSELIAESAPSPEGGAGKIELIATDEVVNEGSIHAIRGDRLSGGLVEVSAARGMRNSGEVQAGAFSLTVGDSTDETDSSSVLGSITSVDTIEITNVGGIAQFDISGLSTSQNLKGVIDGGTGNLVDGALSVSDTDGEIAQIHGASQITAASGSSIEGTANADEFTLTASGLSYLDVEFLGITSIDGLDGMDVLIGRDGQDWSLEGSPVDGLSLERIEVLQATNAGLLGTSGNDVITFTAENEVKAGDFIYRNLTGVNGGSGNDTVISGNDQDYILNANGSVDHANVNFTQFEEFQAGGTGNIDASNFSAGLALTGNNGEVEAGEITFRGLSTAIADSLRGSAQADNFVVQANNVIEARGIDFSGVTTITAGGTNNIATGLAAVDWRLQDSDSASNSGIRFDGFRNLVANNAGLVGTAGDDTFTL